MPVISRAIDEFPNQLCAREGPIHGARFPLGCVTGRILLGHGAEPVQSLPRESAIGARIRDKVAASRKKGIYGRLGTARI